MDSPEPPAGANAVEAVRQYNRVRPRTVYTPCHALPHPPWLPTHPVLTRSHPCLTLHPHSGLCLVSGLSDPCPRLGRRPPERPITAKLRATARARPLPSVDVQVFQSYLGESMPPPGEPRAPTGRRLTANFAPLTRPDNTIPSLPVGVHRRPLPPVCPPYRLGPGLLHRRLCPRVRPSVQFRLRTVPSADRRGN